MFDVKTVTPEPMKLKDMKPGQAGTIIRSPNDAQNGQVALVSAPYVYVPTTGDNFDLRKPESIHDDVRVQLLPPGTVIQFTVRK